MSNNAWADILHWALEAVQSNVAKQAGLMAVKEATHQLDKALQQHAPDVAPTITPMLDSLVQSAVAGVLTRKH